MTEITYFRGETEAATPESDTDAMVAALIMRVGERVRKAREGKGIPRRVLSEVPGVSPCYLAQLEAGEGNISIGLLQRVANALDHRIEWLMAGNPEAMEQLKLILASREALYQQAEAQLDTSGLTVDQSITRLLALIAEHRFLD